MSYKDAAINISRELIDRSRETYRQRPIHLRLREWAPLPDGWSQGTTALCTVCRWRGTTFAGERHSESGVCPRCKSVARDRFLHLARIERVPIKANMRVLETSPRLGIGYKRAMRGMASYTASDLDESLHRADIVLDIENMRCASESFDLIMSAHVLEHVREPTRAIAEMFRVLKPGGDLLLQVPLHQAQTSPPARPEYHADKTPVFWRFGLDLTEMLRAAGFEVSLLVTEHMYQAVAARVDRPGLDPSVDIDLAEITREAKSEELTVLAADNLSRAAWFEPAYMFWLWHARKAE